MPSEIYMERTVSSQVIIDRINSLRQASSKQVTRERHPSIEAISRPDLKSPRAFAKSPRAPGIAAQPIAEVTSGVGGETASAGAAEKQPATQPKAPPPPAPEPAPQEAAAEPVPAP